MARPDYSLVARLLAEETEAVLEALATTVTNEGGELHCHMRNGASFAVVVRGAKRGVFLDKSDLSGGDMLELVHKVLGAKDHRVAYDWGRRFLGLDGDSRAARKALAERREVVRERQRQAVDEKVLQTEAIRRALARYLERGGTVQFAPPIAAYLAGRGIQFSGTDERPDALRLSRLQYHRESGAEWPGMLAPIIDPASRKLIAVHCTYLAERDGAWRKAAVAPQKKVFGAYRGGVVPLLRGASRKPLREAPAGDTVMIAEGIENALAAAQLLKIEPAPRVWAAIAAPNLPNIVVPPQFSEVFLVCDRDGAWENVKRAYELAERRWLEAGLAVTRYVPPVNRKDFAEASEAVCRD